jgi:hypothetical protein
MTQQVLIENSSQKVLASGCTDLTKQRGYNQETMTIIESDFYFSKPHLVGGYYNYVGGNFTWVDEIRKRKREEIFRDIFTSASSLQQAMRLRIAVRKYSDIIAALDGYNIQLATLIVNEMLELNDITIEDRDLILAEFNKQ